MRIPYKINKNTFLTYESSPEALALKLEDERQVISDIFNWDEKHCPSLNILCVEAINANFESQPILNELPCEDRDYLLEILNANLNLEFVVPLIDNEIYWQRRYYINFGNVIQQKKGSFQWKALYIERHIQDILEKAQPEHNDEEDITDLLVICAPYIQHLNIKQLQAWKPPLHWDEEDIPEFYPIDHINFEPVLKKLVYIEEFSVVYGLNNVSDAFNWNMFNLSVLDCQRLGKGVNYLKNLRVLKIHRSKLENQHIRAFMQGFIKNESVEELQLSHCYIEDEGALCIAKILCIHPKLQILNLTDNKIRELGCEGLGFALLQSQCQLQKLNLSLNPLGESGAMGIMRALVRGTKLTELSMAACQYDGDAALRTGQMLMLNNSLLKLDVSNNWFDEMGGQALLEGLAMNKTLQWLDIRETDITTEQRHQILKYLQRNRTGFYDVNEYSPGENIDANSSKHDSVQEEQ